MNLDSQNSIMRIGIIRLSALGDCIVSASMLSDFLDKLRNLDSLKKIHLTWFIDARFSDILKNSPCIDSLEIITLKKQRLFQKIALIKRLKNFQTFDLLIDMQGLLKSAIIGAFLKKKIFIGFSYKSAKESLASIFYTHKVKISYDENILYRNAKLLESSLEIIAKTQKNITDSIINDFIKNRKLSFGYSGESKQKIDSLTNHNGYKILYVLESSLESKTYSKENFVLLTTLLHDKYPQTHFYMPIYSDLQKAKNIAKSCEKTNKDISKFLHILSDLNLDCLKALVDSVDLVIGGDTGLTHLGWAMQKPSITLYGNTPAARFCLKGDKNLFLSGSNNPNYDKFDFSINKISPQEILKAIDSIKN